MRIGNIKARYSFNVYLSRNWDFDSFGESREADWGDVLLFHKGACAILCTRNDMRVLFFLMRAIIHSFFSSNLEFLDFPYEKAHLRYGIKCTSNGNAT